MDCPKVTIEATYIESCDAPLLNRASQHVCPSLKACTTPSSSHELIVHHVTQPTLPQPCTTQHQQIHNYIASSSSSSSSSFSSSSSRLPQLGSFHYIIAAAVHWSPVVSNQGSNQNRLTLGGSHMTLDSKFHLVLPSLNLSV
jgi:hypothetical protein